MGNIVTSRYAIDVPRRLPSGYSDRAGSGSFMRDVALIIGFACFLCAPALVVVQLLCVILMGRAIAASRPDVWEQMRPGFYPGFATQKEHGKRLARFLRDREYLTYTDRRVTRLARTILVGRIVVSVTWIVGVSTVALVLLTGMGKL